MPHAKAPRRNQAHGFRSSKRVVSRRALVWVLVPLLLLFIAAVPAFLCIQSARSSTAMAPSADSAQVSVQPTKPADRFMQSVVTDDGALGWHQLCPSLQAQLPQSELVQQANAEHDAVVKQGVRMTYKFVGIQARQDGGAEYMYVVTARWPNGSTQTRTFNVITQPSGCVEDVKSQ